MQLILSIGKKLRAWCVPAHTQTCSGAPRAFFVVSAIVMALGGCNSDTSNTSDPDNESAVDVIDVEPPQPPEPPQLAEQTLELTYQDYIPGTIEFTGSSAADSDPRLTVVSPPEKGVLVISDDSSGDFEYQPVDSDAWSGDSFTVKVIDGELSSQAQIITLNFTDDATPIVTLLPRDSSIAVSVNRTLRLVANVPLDTSTLSYTSDGSCVGSVQLSDDDFSTCRDIASHETNSGTNISGTNIEFTLAGALEPGTEYHWRVSSDITSVFGSAIDEQVAGFTTDAVLLLISEVGASPYTNIMRWFEVYNAGATTLNLEDHELRSRAIESDSFQAFASSRTFSFPALELEPGQYLVVRAGFGQDTSQVVHLSDEGWLPYWFHSGYLEITRESLASVVDYVSFGATPAAPGDADAWKGPSVTALPTAPDSFGKSMARDGSQTDTNAAADWVIQDWASVGGPNDACGSEDLDKDGIPDCNEQPGTTLAGMPLYDWGARPGRPDIFLEIDYVDSTDGGNLPLDEGVLPRREALQKVVDAFAIRGIGIHIDVGDLYDDSPGLNPANFDLGGGQQVPYAKSVDLRPTGTQADFYEYKAGYFDYRRLPVFHYGLFSTSRNEDGTAGSSGVAELLGNDLIVSLGAWGLNSEDTPNRNALINYQATTLMHELGHNLSLLHGGDDDINDKPNYLSIMNYMYQLVGLPDLGNNEGDRYYVSYALDNCHGPMPIAALIDGPFGDPSSFRMDYSDGSSINLSSDSMNETLGLGRVGSGAVDFNCNGDDSEENADATSVFKQTLIMSDHDDWSNLVIDFGGYSQWGNEGASQSRSESERQTNSILRFTAMPSSDRGPLIEEPNPPAAVLERIRSKRAAP